jgi:general secretion pathway protein K
MRTEVTRKSLRKRVNERGVALIAAMAVVAVLYAIMVSFSYKTNVDYAQAVNARDAMVARYYARSAMNLARVVLKVQKDVLDKSRKTLGDIQPRDYLSNFIGAFGGGPKEVQDMIDAAGAIGGEDYAKTLGVPVGSFDLELDSGDDGRTNVNCGGGSATTQEMTALMLGSLVAPLEYDRVFEEPDGDGQITDRASLVRALIDWVDRDTAQYGANGAPEDYAYESHDPPYKARDNYVDSIDELQLVRGMDERRWSMFSPSLTIYGGCKVNISAITDVGMIRALIFAASKKPEDNAVTNIQNLTAVALRVLQARSYGMQFDDLKSFAAYVNEPTDPLADPEKPKRDDVKGIELDQAKLGRVARVGARRVYRVTATAVVHKVTKKIVAVWDSETTNQNARDASESRGSWVYWREE